MVFSVLMSIYHKENPEYFDRAMISLWDEQTVKPNEVVLVQDGKLTEELYSTINKWQNKLGDALKVISLDKNVGLGGALNEGLNHCQFEYVARMDSDDICVPNRFEKQIAYLKENPNVDILGGKIQEFETMIGDISVSRNLPCTHESVIDFAKKRCPFNHPSIIYRKSTVLTAGGYQDDYLYEDYALWVRMIVNGAVVANLPDPLLCMRAGDNMFKRRGGVKYALSEVKAQYQFYQLGFLSIFELMQNLAIRLPVRLMPNQLRGFIYKKLLRGNR